ncbi:MAG TPA: response regulator [Lacunisphaera sp.]|nr:response regulator [Lacunisphaera sp.]
MPVTFALLSNCLLAALLGVLLFGFLRRHFPELSFASVPCPRPDQFRWAVKPPGGSASRPASASPFPPRASGELLLLVEDEASGRTMLSTVLANHGYEVVTARDGVEAIAVFRRHQERVALVVTDLNMPKSSGRTLAARLRSLRPGVPVLLMSGLEANGSGRDPGTKRTREPFLAKPFRPASLLKAIHALLHPARS